MHGATVNHAADRFAFDRASRRRLDENGFLHVSACHISKETVNEYYGREIPGWQNLGLDPDRIYLGYRPGTELAGAAKTFNGLPLLKEHVKDSAEQPQKELRIGNLGTDAAFNPPYLDNSLVIQDAAAIAALNPDTPGKTPKRELSASYRYDPVFKAGTFNGRRYDFIMTNIRGNHVALVEEGRAGPDMVVSDGALPRQPLAQNSGGEERRPTSAGQDAGSAGLKRMTSAVDDDVPAATGGRDSGAQQAGQGLNTLTERIITMAENIRARLGTLAAPEGADVSRTAAPTARDENTLNRKQEDAADQGPHPFGALFAMLDGREDRESAEGILEALLQGFQNALGVPLGGMSGDSAEEKTELATLMASDKAVMASLTKGVKQHFADQIRAARDVRPLVGDIDALSFDSSADIYKRALSIIGRPSRLNSAEALREVCLLACDAKRGKTPYPVVAKAMADDVKKGEDPLFAHLHTIRKG